MAIEFNPSSISESDLQDTIGIDDANYNALQEYSLCEVRIGARWSVDWVEKNSLTPFGNNHFLQKESAILFVESRRRSGIKWKLWICPVLILDFKHKKSPEAIVSWMVVPRYFWDAFWLSSVYLSIKRPDQAYIYKNRSSLPLTGAPFKVAERFIDSAALATLAYFKVSPFTQNVDYLDLSDIPLGPVVFDSYPSQYAGCYLEWHRAIENDFARSYFFENERDLAHKLNLFYKNHKK